MISESNVKPNAYEIIVIGDYAEVNFHTNITETENEDAEVKYDFNHYRLKVKNNDNLSTRIENNYDSWLAKAIEKEEAENTVEETVAEKIEELESALEILILDSLEV
jgi:hypothetical protein